DAVTIDKLIKKDSLFSPLSDTYQKTKYLNASAGKAGVGVFSMDSVFNALLQGKGIDIVDMNGKPIKVVFGDYTSTPLSDIYASKSKEGEESRYKSQVISAYQSAAVDNEKE